MNKTWPTTSENPQALIRPDQVARRDLGLLATVAGIFQVALQTQIVAGVVAQRPYAAPPSSRLRFPARLLLAPEHEQLGVGGEHRAQRLLGLAAGLDAPLHFLDPLGRVTFDAVFAPGHEGRKPEGVALALSAVAGGFAAAAVGEGQRAGQQILGQVEAADESELVLAEACGLGTKGSIFVWIVLSIQSNGKAFICWRAQKSEARPPPQQANRYFHASKKVPAYGPSLMMSQPSREATTSCGERCSKWERGWVHALVGKVAYVSWFDQPHE